MSEFVPSPHDSVAIDALRFLAVDMVERANSGHPGAPMGQAALAYLEFAAEHPGLDDLLFDPARGPEPSLAVAEARASLGKLLIEPLEQALQDSKPLPRAPWLALCLLRGAVGLTRWTGADPQAESLALVDAGLALFGLEEPGNSL